MNDTPRNLRMDSYYELQKSKEKFPLGAGKTSRNEIRKIRATYLNNIAIALTVTGYFLPLLALATKIAEAIKTENVPERIIQNIVLQLFLIWIVGYIAVFIAKEFRRRATRTLSTIED